MSQYSMVWWGGRVVHLPTLRIHVTVLYDVVTREGSTPTCTWHPCHSALWCGGEGWVVHLPTLRIHVTVLYGVRPTCTQVSCCSVLWCGAPTCSMVMGGRVVHLPALSTHVTTLQDVVVVGREGSTPTCMRGPCHSVLWCGGEGG